MNIILALLKDSVSPLLLAVLLYTILLCSGFIIGCSPSSDLEWNYEEGYRWAEISPGYFGSTGFQTLSASQTGIEFNNRITREEIDDNRHYLNGSGVAAGDINGDGLVDLYFAGLSEPNRLYKNLGGMKFEDITDRAGVAQEEYNSTGAVFADVNGNGYLDLLVTALYGENVLYLNDGEGNFTKDENSGLGPSMGSNTMALADFTGNGYPDLYITNYKEKSVKDIYTTRELDWQNILNEPLINPDDHYTLIPPFDEHYELVRDEGALAGISELGRRDEFYLNQGGKFEKMTNTEEIFLDEYGKPFGLQQDWGLTAKFQDITGNGLTDLYVCNDFHTPDRIWLNQGNGTFKAAGWQAIRNLSYSCMGVDFSDINRNGKTDIFTTEMLDPDYEHRMSQAPSEGHTPVKIGDIKTRPMYNRNSLFIQREDTTWAETSWMSGAEATGWSWATRFMDIDLDGYEDLIVSTGYLYDILDIDAQYKMIQNRRNMDEHFLEFIDLVEPLDKANRILRNNGDNTFTDITHDWGLGEKDVSHGMVFADLNNNGVHDVILNRMNREAIILENTTNAPRVAVRLKGKSSNTQAVGAKIELTGGPVHQQKEVAVGGDYTSGSDAMAVFAADADNTQHEIRIRWPDGQHSIIEAVHPNRMYEIYQDSVSVTNNSMVTESNPTKSAPIFENVSDRINYRHYEEPFNDFDFNALLPFKLSQQGPGVAWIDLNQNGKDELLMSSGRGGSLSILEYEESGNFSSMDMEFLTEKAPGDQTAIIGWNENDYTRVLIGSSNYEQGTSRASSMFHYRISRDGTAEKDSIPGVLSTTGPLAAADVSGNGYLDFFLGAGFKPGQYPAGADSRVVRNEEGIFRPDQVNSRMFAELGLVTGAVFTDYDRSGSQDLLVSTEWGTLRLFKNENGEFKEITEQVGLDKWSGMWKGVATGDFTNNGLPDFVAANIGLNSPYQIKQNQPLRIYYTNTEGIRSKDIIDAFADENGEYIPRNRLYKFQEQQVGLNHMSSHKEFAGATLKEILGDRYDQTPYKVVNTLEHMIFINKGDHFEAYPLPREAQISAGFHVGVADFDNDGNEDVFLSQNNFTVPPDKSRMDAGRGLVLMGDGNGGFTPLSGSESGIKIYGEQRGAAFNDFNQNGKVDLAVSQNGNKMKLYLNRTEKAGYTVTLQGPPSNRNGVGSGVRLVYENGEKGPLREIQSGSGYWSQNSYTQVMGPGENVIKQIEIIWFDGIKEVTDANPGQMNYMILHPDAED
ncbi:MAG: FG-GAP-like repeat-containing protein [Balneolaceae bacterium]